MVSMFICSLVLAANQDVDPNEALANINIYRQQEIIKTPEPRDPSFWTKLELDTKKQAEAALAGFSLDSSNPPQCLAWIKLLDYAHRYPLIPATYEKFITSEPSTPQQSEALTYTLNSFFKSGNFPSGVRFISEQETFPIEDALQIMSATGMFALKTVTSSGIEPTVTFIEEQVQKLTPQQVPQEQRIYISALSLYYAYKGEVQFVGDNRNAALATFSEGMADPRLDETAKSHISQTRTRLTLINTEAPPIKSTKQIGKFDSLESLRGKVVVLTFFANWSNFATSSYPDFRKLYADLKPIGLELLGVTQFYKQFGNKFALEEGDELLLMKSFATENKITWPILFTTTETFNSYGTQGLPYTVLIDRKGEVRKILTGYDPTSFADFRSAVEAALKEPVESPPASGGLLPGL